MSRQVTRWQICARKHYFAPGKNVDFIEIVNDCLSYKGCLVGKSGVDLPNFFQCTIQYG